ncbi:MAG TPA: DEAD/DEAH box helicase, partial [Thermomicrobiales bacterium]|nr:DEAD/DEAH box helicase [Thermomicrobiales bacterium]
MTTHPPAVPVSDALTEIDETGGQIEIPDDLAKLVATHPLVGQFALLYPFGLDTFQLEAIATLVKGESVMVAAPTGSGKTVIAEFGIFQAARGAGRVFYTAPIKALSNQKFRDLRQTYGNEVGLLTGDVSENRDARVLVMTTEILRNMLLQSPW